MEPSGRSDEVITSDSRIVGCRGRVLVAALVLAALALILTATLVYRLFTWTPPVPTRAEIDAAPSVAATILPSNPGTARLEPNRPSNALALLEPLSREG